MTQRDKTPEARAKPWRTTLRVQNWALFTDPAICAWLEFRISVD